MKKVDVVCLDERYDIKALFAEFFGEDDPWVNLLNPDEVSDPEAIQHALAFMPGPEAFEPYVNLRLVSSIGAGVDSFLDNPSLRSDVMVSRLIVPEQGIAMASFATWFIVGAHRGMWDYASQQANRVWNVIYPAATTDFTVGILGYGELGRHLSRVLQPLGYPVIGYGSTARMDGDVKVLSGSQGLAELAARSQAVVNLLPLTEQTRGILSAKFFADMRPEAILVHLGRGAHLVEEDLIEALDQGRLAMAALDVFATEPLPEEHPFWRHEKIKVTPHVAGDVDYGAICRWIAAGISQFEDGKAPMGLVDRKRGY